MSSWMRSLRLIGFPMLAAGPAWASVIGSARRAREVARHALHMPLDGSGLFAFPFLRGFFVEFAPSQLGENACLFTGALETPQGGIEILVLTYSNTRHLNSNLLILKHFLFPAAGARAGILMTLQAKGKMPGDHAHSCH
jgi:hypothetical protein